MDELESLDIIRNMIMRGSSPYPQTGQGPSAIKLADDLRTKSENPESSLYEKILNLLESPLRAKRKPLQLVDPSLGQPSGHDSFHTNIVDFYTSGEDFCTLERKSPVNHIIYEKEGGPAKVMKNAMQRWELGSIGLKHRFR
ncbi:hypothetical protein HYALB_00010141 [Hymenoscyphus albidus]|uniref:Uncharacterized protein n=1 Tax=Hymenoscyphus albidus TaxID=595503 RepID=A0A9N9LGI0_9HELO|nr:hypothetical protein HYALB_00010141 [Hymenoscyphus albidus]